MSAMEANKPLGHRRSKETESQGYLIGSRKQRFGQPFKAVCILAALLIGFLDHILRGWGLAGLITGAALIVPIFGSREFWNRGRYWITVLLLTAAQLPLVVAIRPDIERFGLAFMLAIGVVDCTVVSLAITWVCTRFNRAG
jgi:hypothetical protein